MGMKCIGVRGAIAVLGGVTPLLAQDIPTDTPSAGYSIPLRAGAVEPVTGRLSQRFPLGPRLPGRIPLGFEWSFDNQDTTHWRTGGTFRPVVWPVIESPNARTTITAYVGGSPQTFHKSYAATTAVPTKANLLTWMSDRGISNGGGASGTFVISMMCPSSDGTRWYFRTFWTTTNGIAVGGGENDPSSYGQRQMILDGDSAIWTAGDGTTYFTNRWGDKVSMVESGGVAQRMASALAAENDLMS